MRKLTFSSLGLLMALAGCDQPSSGQSVTVNFGNNTSTWAFDGECDDPRFFGNGMAQVLVDEDMFRDGSDCQALFNAGAIRIRPGAQLNGLQ